MRKVKIKMRRISKVKILEIEELENRRVRIKAV